MRTGHELPASRRGRAIPRERSPDQDAAQRERHPVPRKPESQSSSLLIRMQLRNQASKRVLPQTFRTHVTDAHVEVAGMVVHDFGTYGFDSTAARGRWRP